MKIVKSSPILYSKASTGLDKMWQGHIGLDGEQYFIFSTSWRKLAGGGESKVVQSIPYPTTVKNLGKANETTPLEQAESEFESMCKKQSDSKNYLPAGAAVASEKLPQPMLAQKYRDRSSKIQYPAFVQRKYDGNRMIFDGKSGQSRGGQPMIPEVIQHLQFDTFGLILDGELMLPENVKLQVTMTAIKKYTKELSPKLLYCVYDVVDPVLTYEERKERLETLVKYFPKNVILVETQRVYNEAEMQKYHQQFVLEGFEGTIIRNTKGLYAVGQRSNDLQKHKDFQDAEFKVVDVTSGAGLYDGCAILVCETKEGKRFNSNPEGTLEYKRDLFKNRQNLIGQWLTCRFFDKTADGIPVFNVGVSFREQGEF